MDKIRAKVNKIEMDIYINNSRVIIKPVTDIPNLKNYQFGMNQKDSAVKLVEKITEISVGINEMIKSEK